MIVKKEMQYCILNLIECQGGSLCAIVLKYLLYIQTSIQTFSIYIYIYIYIYIIIYSLIVPFVNQSTCTVHVFTISDTTTLRKLVIKCPRKPREDVWNFSKSS